LRARQRLVRHPTPPRTMTRPRALLALAACLLGLAGCGGSHTATSRTTSTATRRTSTTANQVAHEDTAAAQFAAAYVRFLDGAGTAGGLPDATPSVRAAARAASGVLGSRGRGAPVPARLSALAVRTGTAPRDRRRDERAAGRLAGAPAADPANDAGAAT